MRRMLFGCVCLVGVGFLLVAESKQQSFDPTQIARRWEVKQATHFDSISQQQEPYPPEQIRDWRWIFEQQQQGSLMTWESAPLAEHFVAKYLIYKLPGHSGKPLAFDVYEEGSTEVCLGICYWDGQVLKISFPRDPSTSIRPMGFEETGHLNVVLTPAANQ